MEFNGHSTIELGSRFAIWGRAMKFFALAFFAFISIFCIAASAGTDSSISGTVVDSDGAAISAARVQLISNEGAVLKESTTDTTGNYDFFPVQFGNYVIRILAPGFAESKTSTSVTSGNPAHVDSQLQHSNSDVTKTKEYVVNVKEKRNLVQPSASGSKTDISHDQIETMPGGTDISLPKLLASTTPGVIQGPFGQMFIRGNHANIQYQIDGVQLPDSLSGTFGEAFSPRNIDHMEIITGGVPAEYGERLAAVLNIVTKTGPETPGGSAELNYGSYNTFNPQATYGGSDTSGRFHYYAAASYLQTDRGLDTPQPSSYGDQSHGGEDAIHDHATGDDEFVKLDYILDNSDKLTLNLFNESRFYQIPNYPASFAKGDQFFNAPYQDQFGNNTANNTPTTSPIFTWTPSTTDDSQVEQNSYIEFVWKKTLNEHSFLQVAPYYKRSAIRFNNDPNNDLASLAPPPTGSGPISLSMNRTVDNYGLKTDYTLRPDEKQLIKAGFQVQQSNAAGFFSVQNALGQTPTTYGTPDHGALEAVYVQDSYTILKALVLNAGLRYSATQFNTENQSTQQDDLIQPRIGLEYMATQTTKLHLFYGKLFQPAPFEDLREAFAANGGNASPYDLKAEKDDYYEGGVSQQIGASQVATVNYYYKDAINMLDDTQLANSSIAQPYNFTHGYATGLEFSVSGEFASHWSEFFNYSYEDARGQGINGGYFAFNNQTTDPNAPYQFLDHCQLNTANAGVTYKNDTFWTTLQGIYGSGLRTGPSNTLALPSHTTFDATAGYIFKGESWASKWKVSGDVTNILDNPYPITVNNGYNGSHYAAGREFFVRLTKEL